MKNILLASTTREHAVSLASIMEQQGYFVIHAGDVDLALAFLVSDMPIHAVVADHGMQGFWTLLTAVRARNPLPPAVIVLSDRVNISEYLNAVSGGVFDLFFRPIKPAEFLRVLDAAVRQCDGPSPAIPASCEAGIAPSPLSASVWEPSERPVASLPGTPGT